MVIGTQLALELETATAMPDAPPPAARGSRSTGSARRPVVIIRSTRRHSTISARYRGGQLEVLLPAGMSAAEESMWVERMRRSMERRRLPQTDAQLQARAERLAARYLEPGLRPSSVRWSPQQVRVWGSCTPETGTVRLSTFIRDFPDWVIDYVIVHELAHLRYSGHGPRFWALVQHYPLAERARGYLLARGADVD